MRPIDADVLVGQLSGKAKEMLGIAEQCQGLAINYYTGAKYGFAKAAIIANGLPTIEPRRGKWYDWSFTAFDGCTVWHRVCSVCGYKRDDDNLDKDTNYCPNCGAKMERSEE